MPSPSFVPPSVLVFDLGGVLIEWNPRHLFRKLFDDEAAMERFLDEVCTSDWNARQDAGRPFAEGVAECIDAHPDQAERIRAYHTRWIEMIDGPITPNVELLAALDEAGYELHALSNWSDETFPLVRHQPQFRFLGRFQTLLISGEEGVIKPGEDIFHLLLRRIGRAAADCVFIDDSLPNVETARRLGFHALHFTHPERLRADLRALGFVWDEAAVPS